MAIRKALADIDMDDMFNTSKQEFKSGPKSLKQKALNRLRYIDGLRKNNLKKLKRVLKHLGIEQQIEKDSEPKKYTRKMYEEELEKIYKERTSFPEK